MKADWEHKNDFDPVRVSNSGSELRRDWSAIPWNGMVYVLEAFEEGKKYDVGTEKGWTRDAHIDSVLHLVEHAIAALNTTGDARIEHLAHAGARALMALEQIQREVGYYERH